MRSLIAISCQLERCWRGFLGWRILTTDLSSPSSHFRLPPLMSRRCLGLSGCSRSCSASHYGVLRDLFSLEHRAQDFLGTCRGVLFIAASIGIHGAQMPHRLARRTQDALYRVSNRFQLRPPFRECERDPIEQVAFNLAVAVVAHNATRYLPFLQICGSSIWIPSLWEHVV
jgi:hypothetical protein